MFQSGTLSRLPGISAVMLSLSLMLSVAAEAQSVLTQHNDLSRSGANTLETTLTTGNVNVSSFGKIFSLPIDGFTYAQPLYVQNVSIAGGTHNVVYVATAHDSVYAFDADTATEYWHVSLGTPVPAGVIKTVNIQIEVGIISTPAIDTSTNTIYVTAKTYENSVQIFRLHALDLATGVEKFGGPVKIAATASGSGVESKSGVVTFVASQENQRAAVSLVNGVVYLMFASHEDIDPYHGWVLGYQAGTLTQVQVFNVTPNSGEGAIWMGGQGLVADAANNLYLISANSTRSTENATDDFGESFLKLEPNGTTLSVADYFKTNDYDYLNANDLDLGSGGAFAIPGTTYIAGGSKSGMFYVVNTANMGRLNTTKDQVVQEFQADNGIWGSPAFWNDNMYIWGVNEQLKAYKFSDGLFATTPSSKSAYSSPGGQTSGSISVSSNGTAAGTAIVWATTPTGDPDSATVGGNMYAFDATNLGTMLWNTTQNASRDGFGNYAKFAAPTVVNGKVYVPTDSGQVAAYGLLSKGGGGGELIANGTYTIPSRHSGLALEDPGSSKTDALVMDIGTPTGGSNQNWVLTNLGNNIVTLVNQASGQSLDVKGGSKAKSVWVCQYPYHDVTWEQWQVVSVGNGYYELVNVNSGLALDVYYGSASPGAQIDQYTYQGNSWQQWSFLSK